MPAHLKALLSIAILVVCVALFFYDHSRAAGAEKWVALLLGPLMVISIWIFPRSQGARGPQKNSEKTLNQALLGEEARR